jgi:hypothetical protein
MTVADAYARDDSPDRHFWLYSDRAADEGLEPWRQIDGIDANKIDGIDNRPLDYTLDFANGGSAIAFPNSVIYMQRTKAERAGRWVIDMEIDSLVSVSVRVRGGTAEEAEATARRYMAEPSDWCVTGIDRART